MNVKLRLYRARIIIFIVRVLVKILGLDMPIPTSVGAIIKKGNKTLFVKLNYRNGYALPGGAVKARENLLEALKREVYEETGLKLLNAEYLNSYSNLIEGIYFLFVLFRANVEGSIRASDEGVPEWLDAEKTLNKLVYADNMQALKDYLNE